MLTHSKNPRQPRYKDIFRADPEAEAVAAATWRRVVDDLLARELLTNARLARVDRYARDYAEFEKMYPGVVAEGPVKVSPETGGEYFNYAWSALGKLEDRLARHEKALLITPESAGDRSALPAKKGAAKRAAAHLDA